jgi:hypothetical protein
MMGTFSKVDMNYRFLWDTEPTDEQLLAIMEEVGEDVRREKKQIEKEIMDNIRRAAENLHIHHKEPD